MKKIKMNKFITSHELAESHCEIVNRDNKTINSAHNGKTPEDRFYEEGCIIKRLPDEAIDTSFLLEYDRRVSADNVIVINETEYEVPYIYAKQKITLRYSADFETVYVVNKDTGELNQIKLLNKHDNSHIKREKVRLTGGFN